MEGSGQRGVKSGWRQRVSPTSNCFEVEREMIVIVNKMVFTQTSSCPKIAGQSGIVYKVFCALKSNGYLVYSFVVFVAVMCVCICADGWQREAAGGGK